jgi:23S rRNA pseudouridine1911/1915/1917 synthase
LGRLPGRRLRLSNRFADRRDADRRRQRGRRLNRLRRGRFLRLGSGGRGLLLRAGQFALQELDLPLLIENGLFKRRQARSQPALPHKAHDWQNERQRRDDQADEDEFHVINVSAPAMAGVKSVYGAARNVSRRGGGGVKLEPRTIAADRGDAGRRLDHVVRRHLTHLASLSRTRVQEWIRGGRVAVNERVVTRVSMRVVLGDVLTVRLEGVHQRAVMAPEDLPLDVLYEDDLLLAVNKPTGTVVHPTYRHMTGTIVNGLLWRARTWPNGSRPSIVGRLDKQTSGVVIAAKTPEAHAALQRALNARRAEKDYLTIVYGCVPRERGTIDLRLTRAPGDRRRVVASRSEGAESLTRYERLASSTVAGAAVTLLRCRLATGRMHQIRVHLASSGWPIVGDAKYGEPRWEQVEDRQIAEALRLFPRQALHASRVAFVHPATRQPLAIEAPLPADMAALAHLLGLPATTPV